MCLKLSDPPRLLFQQKDNALRRSANKKELLTDLMVKAKQIEYLINSLPEPEPEEEQAKRIQQLEEEMTLANEEYMLAVGRKIFTPKLQKPCRPCL
ncbi:uncharacterized protein LACBIDRAFT_318194 [Laccaria bicolor S238N-H82]|uniref:Mediator of RNA polymerase II transcription subunit 21 n=1 Tax=Laccaria bicolor (strain S238N-H82 / ATCC MYA-4686) TaxID=486041 RepID=B0D669_LACBS|nr:uncharacterized protein LACBIDRAFT_318194 [Laccaria bicolor S238N-H82]EDR09891.1 predicted protein [Laccaria bicolor S238N-H82]|eukprot:XP_001879276.1 predicted protein [Laccaria bicolor S238N-H82]